MAANEMSFPGESEQYRTHRNRLLAAEIELRKQTEEVASLRRNLPMGGVVEDYTFESATGQVKLSALFSDHNTLILYGFMFAQTDDDPCPMCSAFMDSLTGQLQHINQRAALTVVARSSMQKITAMVQQRNWHDLSWVSCAKNDYPKHYKTESPDGSQMPMCNVFVKSQGEIRHFWASELFFASWEKHPRHVDMLWPLWHIFDITPEGRGDFMPQLKY